MREEEKERRKKEREAGEETEGGKKRYSLIVVVLRLGLFFIEDVDCIIVRVVRGNEDVPDHYVGLIEKIVDVCDRPRRAYEEPAEF